MPAHAAAIVLTDTPQTRLTCRASNGRFRIAGRTVERGVVSYYATLTLPDAGSVADWAARIEAAMAADRAAGRLEARLATPVQGTGKAELPAPGAPVGALRRRGVASHVPKK